jgi:hypothetical protein
MDAGNLVTQPLTWLKKIMNQRGLYVPRSTGCIRDWTHNGTLEYLDVSDDLLHKYNLSTSLVSINYKNRKARKIIEQWKDCALAKECIAPTGSSRANHRQDQAVLTVIAHQSGRIKTMPRGRYGFKVQQDID